MFSIGALQLANQQVIDKETLQKSNERKISELQLKLDKSILDDPFQLILPDLEYTKNFAM